MAGSRQIEMVWRCSACGTENRGRDVECATCGDPKDRSERYEMPGDTARAATVTDPALLAVARGGANWQCAYCGSHQRRADGRCERCGAAQAEGASTAAAPAAAPLAAAPPRRRRRRRPVLWGLGAAGVLGAGGLFLALQPEELEVTVADVRWEHVVHVDRWAVQDREGFAEQVPAAAFERRSLGERHHHDEQVLDHYETETYTEQVACGEDCTTEPESCSEHCTSNDNGFATCTTTCSGGGQRCTTRYCSETRTREVPVYRTERRFATFYAYRVWDWAEHRAVRAAGAGLDLRWPGDDEVKLGRDLGEGERERARRATHYAVTFRGEGGRRVGYAPSTEEELRRFAPGTTHRVRVFRDGRVEVVPPGG